MSTVSNATHPIISIYRSIDKKFTFIESRDQVTQQPTITAEIQSVAGKTFSTQCDVSSNAIQNALPQAKPGVGDSIALKWLLKNGYYPRLTNKSISFHSGLFGGNPFDEIMRKAKAGDPAAQFNLAEMYYTGEGVEQSHEKAVYWNTKAAEQGNANAQCRLGLMYNEGEGTAQSYEKAFPWFTKSYLVFLQLIFSHS